MTDFTDIDRLITDLESLLAARRSRPVDPRDPDFSRTGKFVLHDCSRCRDGAAACVRGNPNQCEFPHARND